MWSFSDIFRKKYVLSTENYVFLTIISAAVKTARKNMVMYPHLQNGKNSTSHDKLYVYKYNYLRNNNMRNHWTTIKLNVLYIYIDNCFLSFFVQVSV